METRIRAQIRSGAGKMVQGFYFIEGAGGKQPQALSLAVLAASAKGDPRRPGPGKSPPPLGPARCTVSRWAFTHPGLPIFLLHSFPGMQ